MAQRARTGFNSRGARFLDPAVLARIDNLQLLARIVVDGFLHGLHRSPHLGLSLDFAEHRAYMPGDDIRRIDWRLFARTDRFFVKQYEAETSATFVALLDISRSMSFGSEETSKLDYARYLAACLTFLSQKQRDRVGLLTFDHEIVDYIPPSGRHMENILHVLDAAEPGRPGELATPMLHAGELLSSNGIVVLISDLYEGVDAVIDAVKPLRYRGHDVMVFHVLDPAELDFPYASPSSFQDLESGAMMPVVPEELAEEYRKLIRAHAADLERKFTANRIDYTLIQTSRPLDHALFKYLSAREKMSRVR
jgi:uncharacterized protein (DUF58 family)